MGSYQSATVDIDWIVPLLAIGGRCPEGAVGCLAKQHRIRRIVDLRAEETDDPRLLSRHGIELLCLPTPDTEPVSPAMLSQGVAWARQAIDAGDRVLVHCEHGIGRSALLACCILVSLEHTPLQAIRVAKSARRKVSPSPRQLQALLDWSRDWHGSRGIVLPTTTWDELAAIAYEHLGGQG